MNQFRNRSLLSIVVGAALGWFVATVIYLATQQPSFAFNPGNVGLLLQRGHIRYWSLAWRDGFSKGQPFYLTQNPPNSPLITRHTGYRIIPSFTHRVYKPGCPPPATPWGPTR